MYQFRDLILKNKHDIKYLGYDFIWDISHKKKYILGVILTYLMFLH